jgi:hypothetical protein
MTLLPDKKLPSSHFFTGCNRQAPVFPLKQHLHLVQMDQFLRSVLTEDKEQVFFQLLGTSLICHRYGCDESKTW